jgi:hypothetical protein
MSDCYDENGNLIAPDNDLKRDPNIPLDPVAAAEWQAYRAAASMGGELGGRGGKAYAVAASMADLASKDAHFEDPAADMSENELQAGAGQICPVCHRAIEAGEPRRRRIDGTYQHDAC